MGDDPVIPLCMYPTPPMLRAARTLLDLKQDEAARLCHTSLKSLVAAEKGEASRAILHKLMGGYMGAGIRFDGSPDYRTQIVTLELDEAPADPQIPEI
ncbi:hypothetical protein Y590_09130 [Methylobacterium sp. AMS5]|nr:hypothetical protein Y590_09130 [Methylobacterium sp. AMS5]